MSRQIAIVIESMGGGGAQHVAAVLANAWVADDQQVALITMQPAALDRFRLDERIHRIVMGGVGASTNAVAAIWANLIRIARLRAAIRGSGADIVLSFIGTTNVLTVLASLGLRRRIVIAERNDPARQSLGRTWDWLRRVIYRRADLVIANSRGAIEAMSGYVPRERMIWLPNPLRTAPKNSGADVPRTSPFFLAVGRLDRQKAHDILLDAFARICSDLPNWQLMVLGDGRLRDKLIEQASTLKLGARVQFAGFVDDPFPWYRAATIFVHPAVHEGLPNAVLEAMSEGLPVIVTDAQEGLREIVSDGVSGVVVPAGDSGSVARAMLTLACEADLRRRLGEGARRAIEPFRADSVVAAWSRAVLQ
jgi:glycosyltransferase involved in cell wall biosynthesis